MTHFHSGRAAVVAVATAASVVLGGGVAYAFWSTTGTGTGATASGSAQALTLSAGTVGSNLLFPSGTGDVVVVISNPNPFPVSVDSLTVPATAATAYTNSGLTTLNATCNTNGTGVVWNFTTKALSGVVVARKVGGTNGSLTLTLTSGAAMSNSSDNSCQSSFFQMPSVTAAPGSSSTGTPVASITL